jgi:putative ABC transport system permease protein
MRVQDIFNLSIRAFRTRPSRTGLTILGMGVGFAAVVVLVGFGYGLQQIMLEKIIFGEALLSLNVSNPASKIVTLTPEKIDEISKIENVERVSPSAGFSGIVSFQEISTNITLNGVKEDYFSLAGIKIFAGDFFKKEEKDKAIISTTILRLFNKKPEEMINQPIKLKVLLTKAGTEEKEEILLSQTYFVKGIIESPLPVVFIPLSEITSQISFPYYESVRVKVSQNKFLNEVQNKIIEKGFLVTALSKTVEQANKVFTAIQFTLGFFGAIALIVSAIGMFNTMTVTLLERTNEIGIMRTIGASSMDIMMMFLGESTLMGACGGIVGILMGVATGKLINFLLNLVAVKLGGVAVKLVVFPIPFLLFVFLFSFVMGFITGLFPARRASKLNPLDAIRYK